MILKYFMPVVIIYVTFVISFYYHNEDRTTRSRTRRIELGIYI